MYHHVKKLMYTVRVDEADPKFGNMLLEQFGGANGELKAAMQYFTGSKAHNIALRDRAEAAGGQTVKLGLASVSVSPACVRGWHCWAATWKSTAGLEKVQKWWQRYRRSRSR